MSDILLLEGKNTDSIHLLKEGIFWRAYNQSAMRLCEYLVSYKVNRKFIKKEKKTIFYCGFPSTILNKIKQQAIEKGFQIIAEDEKIITVKSVPSNDGYQRWEEQQNLVKEPEVSYSTQSIKENDFIKQIREYSLENSTPMEAMLFVQKLKQSIKDGSV